MFKRRFTLAVFAALLTPGLPSVPASAEISVYGGMERFNWREFDASGAKLLEESGYRLFTGMESVAEGDAGLLLDYEGRIYGNNVDYDGQTQDGVPLNSRTSYFGLLAEIKPHYRMQPARFKGSYLDITSALGVDYWMWVLRDGADQLVGHLAVLEHHQARQAADAQRSRVLRVLLGVVLDDTDLARLRRSYLLE